MSAGGTIYALRSTATSQLTPVVAGGDRWRALAPGATPASFPSAKLVTPRSVTFRAPDGQIAYGQLFLPPAGKSAGKHAALLFFHGGPPRQMLVGFHYMSAYSWMYALNEYFASKGYVVLSVNYRGGIGYGLGYREADKFGIGGGSETNDILGAVAFLKGRGDVDAKRIGAWGGSYGGLMTALALARASDWSRSELTMPVSMTGARCSPARARRSRIRRSASLPSIPRRSRRSRTGARRCWSCRPTTIATSRRSNRPS